MVPVVPVLRRVGPDHVPRDGSRRVPGGDRRRRAGSRAPRGDARARRRRAPPRAGAASRRPSSPSSTRSTLTSSAIRSSNPAGWSTSATSRTVTVSAISRADNDASAVSKRCRKRRVVCSAWRTRSCRRRSSCRTWRESRRYTVTRPMAAETDTTGTSMDRATRSAVRCRVPVSMVGIAALGMRCTFALAMRPASGDRITAPSILASSDRRWGLNSASRRKPPVQIDSTSGPSPTTSSSPRLACKMRSMPSRSGWPGATRARASAMAELGRTTTSAWYPPPCRRRRLDRARPRRCARSGRRRRPQRQRHRLGQRPHVHDLHARRPVGTRGRDDGVAKAHAAWLRPAGERRAAPA